MSGDKKKIDLRETASGCYVLTEDVKNPRPDRRASRDWTNAEIHIIGDTITTIRSVA